MRILFAAPYVPSLIRVRPYHLVRELAKHHTVHVLATGSGEDTADVELLRGMGAEVDLVPLTLGGSVRGCLHAAVTGEPLQAGYCRSTGFERRLRTLVRCGRFDVVHVEHLRAAHLGEFLPPTQASVFDAVDSISLLLERTLQGSHSWRQRLIARLELQRTRAYEAGILRRFRRVTVTSPDDAEALQQLSSAAQLTVVPNGVDLDYFRPLEQEPEPATIVLSGKMSYHANVTAALSFVQSTYPRIQAARPDVRLRIVGSRPTAEVRALARDPSITVTGHLPDIREGIGRATVAVCPVTVKVGIQNKILEAMAMRIPVVATSAGMTGLKAVSGESLLVGDDPGELAAHVLELLEHRDMRDRIAAAGLRYVQTHHQWSSAVHSLETVYQAALTDREGTCGPSHGSSRLDVQ